MIIKWKRCIRSKFGISRSHYIEHIEYNLRFDDFCIRISESDENDWCTAGEPIENNWTIKFIVGNNILYHTSCKDDNSIEIAKQIGLDFAKQHIMKTKQHIFKTMMFIQQIELANKLEE